VAVIRYVHGAIKTGADARGSREDLLGVTALPKNLQRVAARGERLRTVVAPFDREHVAGAVDVSVPGAIELPGSVPSPPTRTPALGPGRTQRPSVRGRRDRHRGQVVTRDVDLTVLRDPHAHGMRRLERICDHVAEPVSHLDV